jgi:hypothetical protein
MKASQITTRNRKNVTVIRSLATAAVLTFFVAGTADASCENQVRIESRYLAIQNQDIRGLGVREIDNLSDIPRIDVIPDGHSSGRRRIRGNDWNNPIRLRGVTANYGNTAIPLGDTTLPINNDTEYRRKREEERRLRQRIINGLKGAGVIREPGQPATTTRTGNGTTTTKPKPKPTPKPKPKKPKVTKLPNGDTITEYPDGRREIKMKNGDTVTTHKNGKRVIKRANGDTTETHPSGYRKTTNRYGDGKAKFPDGTTIDFKSSGEATLTTPEGKKFHRMPGKGFKPVD